MKKPSKQLAIVEIANKQTLIAVMDSLRAFWKGKHTRSEHRDSICSQLEALFYFSVNESTGQGCQISDAGFSLIKDLANYDLLFEMSLCEYSDDFFTRVRITALQVLSNVFFINATGSFLFNNHRC